MKKYFTDTKIIYPILISVFAAFFFLLGTLIPRNVKNNPAASKSGLSDGEKLEEVIQFINLNYVDSINPKDLTEKAITSLLQNLDPHSDYLSASDFDENTEAMQGNFEGIGVEFNMLEDTLYVLNAVEGGPSDLAGIKKGDRFIKVNGKSIAGVALKNEEIIKLLKGPGGTLVTVTVYSSAKKETYNVVIKRGTIPYLSIESSFVFEGQTGFIKIARFSSTTLEEFRKHSQKLLAQGMKQLVVDLRDNPGGLLSTAIEFCDEFLSDKKLIVFTKGKNHPEEKFYSTKAGNFEKIPLVVLIDEGSASASEIFAGAIQDHDRGLVIGRRSFGKGLVQAQTPLIDGSAIRLTIARYYTPSGRCIQKPYIPGHTEEYQSEEWERYESGELFSEDSIKANSKLIYKTASGRIVYGGGGIAPDFFVPLDTTNFSPALNRLMLNEFFDDFCLIFYDKNRLDFSKFKNETDYFKSYSVPSNTIDQLINYALKKNIKIDSESLRKERNIANREIKLQLARIHFGRSAYHIGRAMDDPAFHKAVKLLTSTNK